MSIKNPGQKYFAKKIVI